MTEMLTEMLTTMPSGHARVLDLVRTSVARDGRFENPLIIWERDEAVSRSIAETDPSPSTVDPQWIEDRFWIWVHYAATKLGRGELFEVLEFLSFLRGEVLAPLAHHVRGLAPRGVRRFEQHMPDMVPLFAGTVASHDWDACAAAIARCIEAYRTLRGQLSDPIRLGVEVEDASVAYLDAVVADGPAPRSAV